MSDLPTPAEVNAQLIEDALRSEIKMLRDEIEKLKALKPIWTDIRLLLGDVERLRLEVEILRWYGNKDCTAMADAALEEKRRTGKGPWED